MLYFWGINVIDVFFILFYFIFLFIFFLLFFFFRLKNSFGRNEEFIVTETCFQPRLAGPQNGYIRALGTIVWLLVWLLVTYGNGVRVSAQPQEMTAKGIDPALAASLSLRHVQVRHDTTDPSWPLYYILVTWVMYTLKSQFFFYPFAKTVLLCLHLYEIHKPIVQFMFIHNLLDHGKKKIHIFGMDTHMTIIRNIN